MSMVPAVRIGTRRARKPFPIAAAPNPMLRWMDAKGRFLGQATEGPKAPRNKGRGIR